MSTRRNPTGRKESPRSQSLSTSAPRRTDLKISGPLPYPLPTDVPAGTDDNRRVRTSHGGSSGSQTRQSHTSSPRSVRASSRPATYRHDNNTFAASSHVPQDSVSSGLSRASNVQMHRRRASTLRTVMRKLFGRKRRSLGDDLAEDDRESDPRFSSSQAAPGMREGSPYGPVSELPRTRPRTRSHRSQSVPNQEAAFPTVPESPLPDSRSPVDPSKLSPMHSPANDNSSPLPSPDQRIPRRRATLPSIVLSTDDARELANKAAQQTTRDSRVESPTSLGERRGRDSRGRDSSETVARHPKRRSRSANELRKIANAHLMSPIQWRRYSDHNKDRGVGGPPGQSIPEPVSRSESREDELTSLGPDPHNDNASDSVYEFGNLIETIQNNNEVSIEQRVAGLEVKLMDLELAIAKLQGQEVSPFQQSGSKDGSKPQNAAAKTELHPPPALQDPNLPFTSPSNPMITPPRSSPAGDARPESSSTVRPHTSSQRPPSSHFSIAQQPGSDFRGISVEQYSALTTLVRREQSARKLLEDQVLQMRDDIQQLREQDRNRGRSRDRDQLQPPADSFYCPSSPDSVEGGGSSGTPRGSQRGSERGSHHGITVSITRSNNNNNNKKDEPARNRSDSYLPHPASNSPRYAGSFERPPLRKHSTPETSPELRTRVAGMI